jgi:polyisoprenoid-binding protein YceI
MKIITLLLGFFLSSGAVAQVLDSERSSLNYLSIKNGSVAEVGSFAQISGALSPAGALTLDIDLSSVDSLISQRDQRMREYLFNVVDFPTAVVTAQVPMGAVLPLKVGEEALLEISARLNLHGFEHPLATLVRVTRLADGTLRATTEKPILISVADFGLEGGVEKLRSLASLASIDTVVPVYFTLVFKE